MMTRFRTLKGNRFEFLCICGAIIFCVLLWQSLWEVFGLEMDEGMVLIYPELVNQGAMPQLDFESFYTPGGIWFLSIFYRLFGASVEVARFIGMGYHLILCGAIYLYARASGPVWAALAAVTAAILLAPLGLTPFAWLLAMGLLLYGGLIISRITLETKLLNLFAAGLLLGATVAVRQDTAVAVLAMFAMVLWKHGWKKSVAMAGGGGIWVLILIWHITRVGWPLIWENWFTLPVLQTRGTRGISVWDAHAGVAYEVLMSFLAGFALVAVAWMARRRELGVAALVFFLTAHQMMQRVEYFHTAFCAFLPISLLWALGGVLLMPPRFGVRTDMAWLSSPAVVVVSTILWMNANTHWGERMLGVLRAGEPGYRVQFLQRSFYLRDPIQQFLTQKMLNFIGKVSQPNQRLLVLLSPPSAAFSNDNFLYHLLFPQLQPATYHLELNPGSANRIGTRLIGEIPEADWVITNRRWSQIREKNDGWKRGDPEIDRALNQNFALVYISPLYAVYYNKKFLKDGKPALPTSP